MVSRCARCRITEGERAIDRESPVVDVSVSGSRIVSGAVAVSIAVPVGIARALPDAMIRRDRCV
ncbi:hypothetical protein C8258_29930 [Nocardia sp. MDA0666]|nr:hypothetical protein C8258_29930 [Nocardia sp. MDA0666]